MEPVKRAIVLEFHLSPAVAGSQLNSNWDLGLSPQALRFRMLRRLTLDSAARRNYYVNRRSISVSVLSH
jgi:hypothetical protein